MDKKLNIENKVQNISTLLHRPAFLDIPTILLDPFLNLSPFLTRHIHILINYNVRINITYIFYLVFKHNN